MRAFRVSVDQGQRQIKWDRKILLNQELALRVRNVRNFQYFCVAVLVCLALLVSAQENRESKIKQLRARLAPALELSLEELQLALSIKVHETFNGASIIADDGEQTFLGKIDSAVASDSIFNEFGRYGSEFGAKSIWNEFGRYGSEFATYSPFNEFTSSPPFIVKSGKVIGHLTVNDALHGAVDPNWLKMFYK